MMQGSSSFWASEYTIYWIFGLPDWVKYHASFGPQLCFLPHASVHGPVILHIKIDIFYRKTPGFWRFGRITNSHRPGIEPVQGGTSFAFRVPTNFVGLPRSRFPPLVIRIQPRIIRPFAFPMFVPCRSPRSITPDRGHSNSTRLMVIEASTESALTISVSHGLCVSFWWLRCGCLRDKHSVGRTGEHWCSTTGLYNVTALYVCPKCVSINRFYRHTDQLLYAILIASVRTYLPTNILLLLSVGSGRPRKQKIPRTSRG